MSKKTRALLGISALGVAAWYFLVWRPNNLKRLPPTGTPDLVRPGDAAYKVSR